jgi:hypothetical protein
LADARAVATRCAQPLRGAAVLAARPTSGRRGARIGMNPPLKPDSGGRARGWWFEAARAGSSVSSQPTVRPAHRARQSRPAWRTRCAHAARACATAPQLTPSSHAPGMRSSEADAEVPRSSCSAFANHARILPMALGYTICSSMLMVVNKLVLKAWPFPSLLMAVQFLFSAAVVRGLSLMGKVEVEPLVAEKARAPCAPGTRSREPGTPQSQAPGAVCECAPSTASHPGDDTRRHPALCRRATGARLLAGASLLRARHLRQHQAAADVFRRDRNRLPHPRPPHHVAAQRTAVPERPCEAP